MLDLAHEAPAGGTPIEDLVPATIVGLLALAAVVALGVAHRGGRLHVLTRAARLAGNVSGLPGWAALPAAIAGAALLVAVLGFYWDVATHIDNGRDEGPFANPSHFLIIGGLAGVAFAGAVSLMLGRDEDRSSLRIAAGWHVPIGGLLLLLCGGVAVLGFPLDDVWHRLFGQDVTLWSPTHVQMVGGAALSTLALWVLIVEGRRAAGPELDPRRARRLELVTAGSFLIGLSALQAEFDYSVPQFRLLFHPVLLMGTAGCALVAARIRLGRGGALAAVAMFLVIRGSLSLLVGPIMGHTTLHFPLYVAEALAVEVVALRLGPRRQLSFGAVCGIAIGTVGLAAEWAWSHLWMTMSWPASLAPEAVPLGLVAAVGGGLAGGYIGRALTEPDRPRQRVPRLVAVATFASVLVALAYPFPTTGEMQGRATFRAAPVAGRPGWARLEVDLEPPSVADDSEWFVVTAWQGGGSVVEPLEPTGNGTYASSSPVPVSGQWKTLVRLHDGNALLAVPVYLPEDRAIPAPGTPAPGPGEARSFVSDKRLLLREAKDVSMPLTMSASALLAALVAAWVAAIAAGLHRLETGRSPARRSRRVARRVSSARTG